MATKHRVCNECQARINTSRELHPHHKPVRSWLQQHVALIFCRRCGTARRIS